MGDPAEEPKLQVLKGGRKKSFSIGGAAGSAVALCLVTIGLLALGCVILGGVWCVEQLWNAVT